VVDELSMSDAMVGVADHELAGLAVGGVAVGEAASLIERAAPDGGAFIGKLHIPGAVTLMVDADGGVHGRGHESRVAF
jgi:hypothetical protein